MAQGPDPNRHFDSDRENSAEEVRRGGGLGDPRSSRLGLSSGLIAVLAVLIAAAVAVLLL